jgi:hypothetical protein
VSGGKLTLPTEEQVTAALKTDAERGSTRNSYWAAQTRTESHPSAIRIQKFRELAYEATVGRTLDDAHKRKQVKYDKEKVPVVPFVLSAGGGVHPKATEVLKELWSRSDLEVADRNAARRYIYGRMSVTLIKWAENLYQRYLGQYVPCDQEQPPQQLDVSASIPSDSTTTT